MKGLIATDLYALKKQLLISGAVGALYLGIAVFADNVSMVVFLIMFGAMMPISAFTFNEQCHWDTYANTLPVRRRDFVGAKCVMGLGFMLVATVLSCCGVVLANVVNGRAFYEGLIMQPVAGCVGLIYVSAFLVLIFKLGVERARMFMVMALLIPAFGVLYLQRSGMLGAIFSKPLDMNLILCVLVLATVAIFAGCYLVCLGIYKRKEL